jgi:hypothetical protein
MDRLQKLMNPQFFYKHDRPHKVRLFWNREVLNDFEKRQKKLFSADDHVNGL